MSAPHEHRDQRDQRDYDDIPGTFVFDGRRSRRGYPLNRFLMSLNDGANREAFRAGEAAYLDRFRLDDEQREAVLGRDWLRLLELGGNVYYLYKLAACDGMTFQDLAGQQTGMTVDAYAEMMLAGGRPVDGNRSRAEGTEAGTGAGAGGRPAERAVAEACDPAPTEVDSAVGDVARAAGADDADGAGVEPGGPGAGVAGS